MFTSPQHHPTKTFLNKAAPTNIGLDRKQKHDRNNLWQSLALSSLRLQPKLSISQPGDADEREADHIADRVMRMASPQPACSCSHSSEKVQRKCAGCEEEERVQRKATGAEAVDTANVDHALSSPGRPLDAGTRS